MELTVLMALNCPNAAILECRLAQALAGRPGVTVQRLVLDDPAAAARWGMHGSPTLLVDGRDLFAGPDAVPAVACRMYPSENGRMEGAPTVPALRRALGHVSAQG